MVKKYIPEAGDIIWIDFSPTQGHEQSGKRPAIVISEHDFSKRNGLVTVCPITSRVKDVGSEFPVLTDTIKGVVLFDQFKTIDVLARDVSKVTRILPVDLKEIRHRVSLVLGIHS